MPVRTLSPFARRRRRVAGPPRPHVHVYRRQVDPDYLGIGAVFHVCSCGQPRPTGGAR